MSNTQDQIIQQGNEAFIKKDYQQALEFYQQITKQQDPTSLAFTKQGQVYIKLKQQTEAINSLKEAIKLDNNNWLARVLLGNMYFDQGNILDSINQFKEAVGDNKIHFIFDELNIINDNNIEQNQDLLQKLNNFINLDSENCRALIFRGIINIKLGNFSVGKQDFETISKNQNNMVRQIIHQKKITYVENRLKINYKQLLVFIEENSTPQPYDDEIKDYSQLNKGYLMSGQVVIPQQQQEEVNKQRQQQLNEQEQDKSQKTQQQEEEEVQQILEQDIKQSEKQVLLSNSANKSQINFKVSQQQNNKYQREVEVEKQCCKCTIF